MEAWMQVRKQVQRRRVRSRFEGDTDLRLGFDTMQRPFITFSYCHPFALVVGGTGARGVTGGAMEGVTEGAREGTTRTVIDTLSTSGSLLPMYRTASRGQQRSTNRSKYRMMKLGQG